MQTRQTSFFAPYKRHTLAVALFVASLASCDSSQTPSDQPPVEVNKGPTLPVGLDAEGLCEEGADREQYFQPSLNAYAALADSIFVGTIVRVRLQESPVLHCSDDPTNGLTELGTIEAAGCPSEVAYIHVIELSGVETLHGQDVGSTLNIPVTYGTFEHEFGVYFDPQTSLVANLEGEEFFRPGTQIGGLIRTNGFPAPYLSGSQHTMFEIRDEVVHLRQPTLPCLDVFDPFGIPDEFDGQPLSVLKTALLATGNLTVDEQNALTQAQTPFIPQPGQFNSLCIETVGE